MDPFTPCSTSATLHLPLPFNYSRVATCPFTAGSSYRRPRRHQCVLKRLHVPCASPRTPCCLYGLQRSAKHGDLLSMTLWWTRQ
uniref:Uncharacterized protein n=1 Tax=Setaria italica TaxID=4555 RepID=K3YX95_SETIT